MGKRGRKPGVKQDGVSKLERSRMSARECRVRKKLRYEYLEDLVTCVLNIFIECSRWICPILFLLRGFINILTFPKPAIASMG